MAAPQFEIPVFEQISAVNAERENVLARRWAAKTWNFGNSSIMLQPMPVAFALASTDHWGLVSLMIAGRAAELYAPLESLERIVTSVDPSIGADRLDPTARALIVEHALAPVFDAFERATKMTIEVRGVTAPQGLEPSGAFGLRAAHSSFGDAVFLIQCDSITTQKLSPYIEQWDIENIRPAKITLPVSFRIGYTVVDMQMLYELGLGDGIVIDNTSLEQNSVIAVISERYTARCSIMQNARLELIDPLLTKPTRELERYVMVDHPDEMRGDAAARVGTFGELPVTLVFELGRMEVSLSELETVREGYIFNLNKTKMQSVDIMTGGRVIGQGEIVKIGDSFGVRVRGFARP